RPAGQPPAPAPAPPKAVTAAYDGPVYTLAPEGERQAPPPIAEPLKPVLPTPAERTLPNGLRVIVAKSSDLPLVTAELNIRTGAWADPPGLAGAVAMTGETLPEGTRTRSARQIAAEPEALGARPESGGGLESSQVS